MYGDTLLSQLPVDIENNRLAQLRFFQPPSLFQLIPRSLIGVGRWTKNGIFWDSSKWQTKADKITTSVDWAAINHPQFHGGYCKYGEAWGTYAPQSDESRLWKDPSWESNKRLLLATGKLCMGYIYYNPAWSRDLGWTEGSVDDLLKGSSIDEIANKLIHYDPNIYLICMMLKDFTGQTFTAAQLKSDPDADVDGLVIDLEKYWLSNNAVIGDFWIYKTLSTTLKGLQFLADNGYLNKWVIDRIIIYSSEWFLKAYGNVMTRDLVAHYDSIPAGYYYDPAKSGYINCDTIDELIAVMDRMSGVWQPYNIGAGIPGKVVFGYQVLDNITSRLVTNPSGGPSAIDVNSLNISPEALFARCPRYKARRDLYENGSVASPSVSASASPSQSPSASASSAPVDMVAVATIKRACYMRSGPGTSYDPVIPNFLLPVGTRLEILDTVTVDGNRWRKVRILGDFFVGDHVKNSVGVYLDYLDITEEPRT